MNVKITGDATLNGENDLRQLETMTADQLERMRPTLIVCLGGSGQMIGSNLKATLKARFGDRWRKKIRLLAFDTTEEPFAVQAGDDLIRLEPGAEFFHIGNVPVPNIMRNLHRLTAIRQRMGSMLRKVPPAAMRHGAKSIRLLALLALYWHFNLVYEQLRRAIWSLAGRDVGAADLSMQQQGINIFVCFSLVGGTGSGLFLDVTCLIRHLFNELGEQGQFCHITGVAVLPQAFQGAPMETLFANAAAAIEELNHLMVHGNFEAVYPGGQRIHIQEALFNLLYAVDGVDERGQTWPGINEVTQMAAQAIYMQMASQLGRKGENAFDNVDDVLIGRSPDGYGTFMGSFGLGYLEFPAPLIADFLARQTLAETARQYWLAGADQTAAEKSNHSRLNGSSPTQLLEPAARERLTTDLLRDAHGGELRLELSQPVWLSSKRHDEIPAEAVRYVREFGLARLNEDALRQVAANGAALAAAQKREWFDWANQTLFTPELTLPQIERILEQARETVAHWLNDGRDRLSSLEQTIMAATVASSQAQTELQDAAGSLFIGRNGRVQRALERYFEAARQLCQNELHQGVLRAQRRVWSELSGHLAELSQKTRALTSRLEEVVERIEAEMPERLRGIQDGGVSRISLVSETYLQTLYQQSAPARLNLATRLTPLELADLNREQLQERLLAALSDPFTALRQKNIRAALAERAQEMTFHARQRQLFRLATPSWSIDRARLPEGGAALARIEVMGVPDAGDELYGGGGELVSTYDPHRLAAFVMVAGAPPTALQQFDRYRRALEQIKGYRPMYVLPQFLAESGQGRLAFALGSIFNFIMNQGAYFYYQPADNLTNPIRLGNGLANAIQFLENRDDQVREIMERVEGQIAQLGLQQAIEELAGYYELPPNGKTPLDELNRELKQMVRAYAEKLRQVDAFRSDLRGKVSG